MAEACSNSWFALVVKPQHERAVAEQLRAKSLENYVPLARARRRWSDRMKTLDVPLFPRYVFCRFAFEQRLSALRTVGVTSVVSFAGEPARIPDEEIAGVRMMVDSGRMVMPWPFLRVGQRVRIDSGPLEGLVGVLVREKAGMRVVVNVELLNRAVAVEIERDLITVETGGPTRAVA
jgi:transcription antitermination factor NusG